MRRLTGDGAELRAGDSAVHHQEYRKSHKERGDPAMHIPAGRKARK